MPLKFDIPAQHRWRLLLDACEQSKGASVYETSEPGYLDSMFLGLGHLEATLNDPLSLELLVNLHDKAITKAHNTFTYIDETGIEQVIKEPIEPGIRDHYGTEFGLVTKGEGTNCSKQGLIELLQKLKTEDPYFSIQSSDLRHRYSAETLKDLSDDALRAIAEEITKSDSLNYAISIHIIGGQEAIKNRVQQIIQNYHCAIKLTASNEQEKIKAIATCIHELELTHPFYDGNCRTMAILLLNKLLKQQGLSLCILYCKDRFDAFSIDELCQEIITGQQRYQQLIHPTNIKKDKHTIYEQWIETLLDAREKQYNAVRSIYDSKHGVLHAHADSKKNLDINSQFVKACDITYALIILSHEVPSDLIIDSDHKKEMLNRLTFISMTIALHHIKVKLELKPLLEIVLSEFNLLAATPITNMKAEISDFFRILSWKNSDKTISNFFDLCLSKLNDLNYGDIISLPQTDLMNSCPAEYSNALNIPSKNKPLKTSCAL